MHAFAIRASILAILLGVTAAAVAQPQATAPGWQTEFGAGVIVNPRFQGSDDYRVLAVPYIDLRYVDERGVKWFANVPQGVGGWLLRRRNSTNGHTLNLGLALAPGFANRDEDDLPGLEDFGPAVEARGYINYGAGPLGLQASLSQAVASGHEGLYADLSASWRGRLGKAGFWRVGPTVRIGNGTYNNALYGVSTSESLTSGLSRFQAGGGIESAAVQGVFSVPISEKWRWTSIIRGGRLVGDAADSPVAANNNQYFALTAFTRKF